MTWKVTNGHLSFRELEKILPNTFIYESILIKIYIILTLWIRKYWRSQKVTFMFILTLTYVLMDNFLSLFFFVNPYFSYIFIYLPTYLWISLGLRSGSLKWNFAQQELGKVFRSIFSGAYEKRQYMKYICKSNMVF